MPNDRMIQAIGRIENALSKLEKAPVSAPDDGAYADLLHRHAALKADTQTAIHAIDAVLNQAGQ